MPFADRWTLLLRNPNWRFFFRLLSLHVALAAVVVPLSGLTDRESLPWSAYIAFGLVWWLFVGILAARLVYQVASTTRAAVRSGIWLGGACGLAAGGFFSLAETSIVNGFPPIVLFFTPFVIFGATFVGGMLGWLAGLAANGFARLLVR